MASFTFCMSSSSSACGALRFSASWSRDLNTEQVKKLVDSAPQTILPRMARTQAEAIKVELKALGAQVRLVPAEA
jgi:Ribosomal protein L7/L12 C-terminal domain